MTFEAFVSTVVRKLSIWPVPQEMLDELDALFRKWYTTDQACAYFIQKMRSSHNTEVRRDANQDL